MHSKRKSPYADTSEHGMPAKMTGEMMIPGKSLGTAVAEGEGVGLKGMTAGPLSLTPASFDACSSSRKSSSVKALVQKCPRR
jgi:hypothetical protein